MKPLSISLTGIMLLAALPAPAQQEQARQEQARQQETYDYWQPQRELVRLGQQAVFLCNGLFTSNRTLEEIFDQELAYLREPVGTAEGGDYEVHREQKAVTIGSGHGVPKMRAAFRQGIGCVVLAPDQALDDIADLPAIEMAPPPGNPAEIPWPDGDLTGPIAPSAGVDAAALQAASDWAFERESSEQVTLSLLIVHRGRIVLERYAEGVDRTTRTRTWSTAKSIASTLIGMLVDDGLLSLDAPLGFGFLPEGAAAPEADPRSAITLRQALHMSTGLQPVDNGGLEYAVGSGLSYWAGASSVEGARRRALIRTPGANWDYENYDTLLAVYAMKRALGSEETYHRFPRMRLLDPLGMRNTLLSTDRFGDFVLSSQVYTNARDLARFGLLYLQDGVWNGERLLSREWIDFVRTPAPSTADRGNFYGGQFWLVPDERTDAPRDAYSTAGNRGQFVVIVPSHDLVIVRRGLDYGRQGFDRWDLTREVVKAFPRAPAASSPAAN